MGAARTTRSSSDDAAAKSEAKYPSKAKVGDFIDLPYGALVLRPDGSVATAGGTYALNVAGDFVVTVGGAEHTVTVSEK